MANTVEFGSVEEARQYAQENGPALVLSRETLDQIEAAEAAGGFQGGMSGSSGEGGFSAPGSGGVNSSSASDPVPVELLDMHGSVPVGAFFEEATDKILDIKDVWEAFRGHLVGPIILVPKRELDRWLGNTTDDA
jgi:hypothetical protein